jgi:hypothetical protein
MFIHVYIIHAWLIIHRDTEECLNVSACKFFAIPFSLTLFQKRSGSPSWRPRPEYSQLMYELELGTDITHALVFDVFEFTDRLFILWRLSLRYFIPTWSSLVGCIGCSGNNWISRDMHNTVLFYTGCYMKFSLPSFLHSSYWLYDHTSRILCLRLSGVNNMQLYQFQN